MNRHWQTAGIVTVEQVGEFGILRVEGNLHRDLSPTEQDRLVGEVARARDLGSVLVDLVNIDHLDSWGEGRLADVVDDVIAAGGKGAVYSDADRPYLTRSLRVLLDRHGDRVRFGTDEDDLRSWLQGDNE